MRAMMATFKTESQKSERMIKQLEIQGALVQQERQLVKDNAEKKIKQLAKDFVEQYTKLGDEFDLYKEFVI